jgi:tetratricopeptide (TPR) repeat protein
MRPKKEITPEAVVMLLVNSALVAKLLADYPDAESRLDRAAALAETAGLAGMKLRVLSEKAGLYYQWGRYDDGLELAARVITTGGSEYSEYLAGALNTAGNIHLRRCEFDEAEGCFRKALDNFRKLKMEISVGTATNNLANIHNIRGDSRQAKQLYQEALEKFEGQNDMYRSAHVMYSLAQIHFGLKQTVEARHYLNKSSELRRSIQDYRGMTNNLLMQIGMLTDERDFDGARELLRQADQVIAEHKLTDPHLRAYREGEAGLFHLTAGEYDQAEGCFLRLIEMSQRMKEASFISRGYSCLGKARVLRDGNGNGIADIKKGIELAAAADLPLELKDSWSYITECYCRLGMTGPAEQAAREYVREAVKQGDTMERAEAEIAKLFSGK